MKNLCLVKKANDYITIFFNVFKLSIRKTNCEFKIYSDVVHAMISKYSTYKLTRLKSDLPIICLHRISDSVVTSKYAVEKFRL